MSAVFFLFLLLIGFSSINWIATRRGSLRSVNALPARPTARSEWVLGAMIGWGMALAAILPLMLTGALRPSFWFQFRAFPLTLLSLLTIAALTLALEVLYRGYLFARLIQTVGPTLATILLALVAAVAAAFHPHSNRLAIVVTFVLSSLFSLAYLRTHALWLSWGLHFAWSACIGVLFGLPLSGVDTYLSVVSSVAHGHRWLTGGSYGPEAAFFTAIAALIAMAILYRQTRDLSWEYTHTPIVSGGHPMDIAPPAAHTAMEQAARPAPLVQILSTTPSQASTMPAVEEHLRSNRESGE